MSDLISRSELLEEIKSLSIVLNGKQIFSDDAKDTILRIINEQPTAYSVDKVVEELEKLKMRYFLTIANTGDEKSDFAYENVGNALDKAIEIVKQGGVAKDCNNCANYTLPDELDNCYLCCKGYEDNYEPKVDNGGVSDDVCEWYIQNSDYKCNTHAETYDSRVLDWNICPYCGKKIKVVE